MRGARGRERVGPAAENHSVRNLGADPSARCPPRARAPAAIGGEASGQHVPPATNPPTPPRPAPGMGRIAGFCVPPGTCVTSDSNALNFKDRFRGESAEERKERRGGRRGFLEERGAERRYRCWRFGFGPRVCLGRYVADRVLKAVVVGLVGGGR